MKALAIDLVNHCHKFFSELFVPPKSSLTRA
jgi:hypothetical protein